MNGVDSLRSAFRASHYWFDQTTVDVTDEQATYRPPGRVSSIAQLAAHIAQSEDMAIQQLAQGRPTLWESGNWEEQTGVPNALRLSNEADAQFTSGVSALKPYADAVFAATDEYLGGLSDADLDREIDMSPFGMEAMRLGDVLTLIPLGNTFAHTGEISAIKGLQGAQGYPF
ncbi:MAG: DinB family protein [Anaerolineae bacterium]|jgi:uncharacterized damage-inducible protein DinB